MSADARLTAAALERLSDLEVAAALAEGTMLSANERGQTASYHRHSESARSKLGAVAEEQRARHAAVILLINRIRQWLREQGDVGFEDVDSPAVEQLAGAQLEAAIGSLRKAIRERQAEMGEAKAAPLPKADQKKLARAYAIDLAAKGRPKLEVTKGGQFLAEFHDRRFDVELVALPNLMAAALAWLDADRFASRLEAEIDAQPDVFSLSASAKTKRLVDQI
jgi:hypothetical protein